METARRDAQLEARAKWITEMTNAGKRITELQATVEESQRRSGELVSYRFACLLSLVGMTVEVPESRGIKPSECFTFWYEPVPFQNHAISHP